MSLLKKLWHIYPNYIKYWILIVDIIFMFVAIKVYVNYISIENAIDSTVQIRENKADEIDFTNNFLLTYEASDYSRYFLWHENNMLNKWEYIIRFDFLDEKPVVKTWTLINETENPVNSPQKAWQYFLKQQLKK